MITNNPKISQSTKKTIFRVLRQMTYTKLFKKYSSGNFSYHKILANNLVFNDTCRIVARFKDYLILDDNTEFLRRFYNNDELHPRLDRILNFYETYSKIFPNYMILKESKYLYRNIRKKQKMIDAVNEIKREEEENRKKMKVNNNKDNINDNELFTKKVKEEIKTFQENTTFQRYNNNFDSDNEDCNENSISISLINRKMFENMENKFDKAQENGNEKYNSKLESFVTNETNHSISGILNVLNDNKIYIQDLPKIFEINTYSKNSQKIKKYNKKPKKIKPEIEINENNNHVKNYDKQKNKQEKQFNKISKQIHYDKKTFTNSPNIINSINNNYISTKDELKKISMLSTSPGTVLASNTEKNVHEINQYQNIIIPKGNTVININNNYFEQTPSPELQMGYYTNKNFKMNTNSKNNKYNSIVKTSNINNNSKKENNLQMSEKKNNPKKFVKTLNNEDKLNSLKNTNYIIKNQNHHNKQISQDYIYHKSNNKTTKNEISGIKEKIIKFNSLSPTPILGRIESKIPKNKKNKKSNNYVQTEKDININYLTENNNPNLIIGNTKTVEDVNDTEREKLLLHIRDIIENKKKEKNNLNSDIFSKHEIKGDILFSHRKNKIKSKIQNDENNFSAFAKNKTISNFKSENKDFSNVLNKETNHKLREKCFSKKDMHHQIVEISKEKKEKSDKKNKYKKLSIKEKKNKNKGFIKSNKITSNYNTNTNSKTNSDNIKTFFKTNNNFKNHRKLFDNMNKENSLMNSMEKQIKDKNKILNVNNQALKSENIEKEEKDNCIEKNTMISSQSILYKSTVNSQLSKLLMSYKKESECSTENGNASMKIYHKGKIKNMKFKKENLHLENTLNNNTNSICFSNLNNFYTENANGNNNIILTDNIAINKKVKPNDNNKFNNSNNSELRSKYKNFLLRRKNKIKSCEFENQSSMQQKTNKELIDRITLLKKNINKFYQNYTENVPSLGIKSYRTNNINSFDNTNTNLKKVINTKEQNNNYKSEKNGFQTPSMENKRIGLYKKVINKKMKLIKTEKKLEDKRNKNYITPGAIKVNRSKFLGNVKNKIYDNSSKIKKKK